MSSSTKRIEMPQIASKDLPEFLSLHHIPTDVKQVDPSGLQPTQSEFYATKVVNMPPDAAILPIIISKDDYVLDGHHRWLYNCFHSQPQNVIVLPWKRDDAIANMHAFSKSYVVEDTAPTVSVANGAIDNTVTPKPSFKLWRRNKNDSV